jgi:hypothetical protein
MALKEGDMTVEQSLAALLHERAATLRADPPPELHHYTSASGLQGILESHCLRATHTDHLNDPTEVRYTKDLVRRRLTAYIAREEDAGVRQILQLVADSPFSVTEDPSPDHFIACFCENNDLLSQWRSYGNSGGGYSLTFATDGLRRLTQARAAADPRGRHALEADLIKVVYNETDQTELVDAGIERFVAPIRGLYSLGEPDTAPFDRWGVVASLSYFFYDLYIRFKHPAFSEECEWRLVAKRARDQRRAHTPAKVVGFREKLGLFAPYIELATAGVSDSTPDWKDERPRLPIRSITFGPALDPETAAMSTEWLAMGTGYTDVQVHPPAARLR